MTGSLKKPKVIYVDQFDTSVGSWRVDRSGDELKQFKQAATTELQYMLVVRLQEIASSSNKPAKLPGSGLLVKGEFTRVNQGSRALRMGIGFGAGGTKVETRVKLYDLAVSRTKPIATFETTGGSNAQPGLIGGDVITGTIFAAANATGLTADWNRTAREIRNFIRNRFTN
ncbi:MAG: DUF4410 domain-containing protein [Verrucomicrobiota bacterium]